MNTKIKLCIDDTEGNGFKTFKVVVEETFIYIDEKLADIKTFLKTIQTEKEFSVLVKFECSSIGQFEFFNKMAKLSKTSHDTHNDVLKFPFKILHYTSKNKIKEIVSELSFVNIETTLDRKNSNSSYTVSLRLHF